MFGNLFNKSFFGLDISDESIKFVKLNRTKNGINVERYGEIAIHPGTIEFGKIKDTREMEEILFSLRRDLGIKVAHISVLNDNAENMKHYINILKNCKIKVKSIEHHTDSISRSLLKKGDKETYMIVNINKSHSHIFIISDGVLAYRSLASGTLSLLRDEIPKHFLSWHTYKNEENKNNPAVSKIILCGDEPDLIKFSEYLSVNMRNKVEVANVWVNILDTEKDVPEINHKESFGFATALGLALKDF